MKTPPGFPHKDLSWLGGLIAIRAPLKDVKSLISVTPKQRIRDTQGFQSAGSDFTLLWWEKFEPDFAKHLSQVMQTMVAYLWDEDTSGWFGYSIFQDGMEKEVYEFGMNYDDEFEELAEELGEDMPSPEKRGEGWDVFVSEEGQDYQFRSTLTTSETEAEISQGLEFVNTRFQVLGIPIPRHFPKEQELFTFQ